MTTTLEVLTPDRVRRIEALHASGNESAKLCATDAAVCLMKADSGWGDLVKKDYTEAADRWIARGAQHLFGWPRNNPEGW